MRLNSGRKLACFSARGASLHGPCSRAADERRKLACFQTRGASSHAFQPGAQACMDHAAWLRIRGASSHAFKLGAQARMLFSQGRKLGWTAWLRIGGASSHACKRGAPARALFSQGCKLAWTMQHSHGSEVQARMFCFYSGGKLACFAARGASLHGPCSMITDERRKFACV